MATIKVLLPNTQIIQKEAMKIGVPTEIKSFENRVAMRPAGVELLCRDGHEVQVQSGAGQGSGFSDEEYKRAGAEIVDDAAVIWNNGDMIVKVKEPLKQEFPLMRRGQIIFTYFHFAADRELTEAVLESDAIAIAYETVQNADRSLPLLIPMSEVAGRMAVQQGAKYLEKTFGGRGVLLSGVPGTPPADVVVLGGGIVGANSAKIAAGMGALVTILDVNVERLRYLDDIMPPNVSAVYSDLHTVRDAISSADLVIGSVLLPGKKAPHLVVKSDLRRMQPGAVIVDVAIDQGGCIETSRPTTHNDPIFEVDGIVHYCVTNMPGAVPRTSTFALTNSTFPFVHQLANQGWHAACHANQPLMYGLNVVEGKVTHAGVAEAFEMELVEPALVI